MSVLSMFEVFGKRDLLSSILGVSGSDMEL